MKPTGGFLCIEEPENNLHPSAQEQLVEFLKREAGAKQVILTTHSPIIVNNTSIKNIIHVTRDVKTTCKRYEESDAFTLHDRLYDHPKILIDMMSETMGIFLSTRKMGS